MALHERGLALQPLRDEERRERRDDERGEDAARPAASQPDELRVRDVPLVVGLEAAAVGVRERAAHDAAVADDAARAARAPG